ncbi:hypothetical protein ASPCAL03446 [Aspergillus calidoustus]|uniref:Uncharacterized protein n=1 Tax=Aspergillus calidoustus TaxID=454130 RepID=A0A0U5FSH9_ASPCI|nr:hypothetical protein ASPCAL03446 [Aspergillus calidoustus]
MSSVTLKGSLPEDATGRIQVLVTELIRAGVKAFTIFLGHSVKDGVQKVSVHFPSADSLPEKLLAHVRVVFSREVHSPTEDCTAQTTRAAGSLARQWMGASGRDWTHASTLFVLDGEEFWAIRDGKHDWLVLGRYAKRVLQDHTERHKESISLLK